MDFHMGLLSGRSDPIIPDAFVSHKVTPYFSIWEICIAINDTMWWDNVNILDKFIDMVIKFFEEKIVLFIF